MSATGAEASHGCSGTGIALAGLLPSRRPLN